VELATRHCQEQSSCISCGINGVVTLKPAILALIRQILTVVGTALVAKGYVQASDVEPVIGPLCQGSCPVL